MRLSRVARILLWARAKMLEGLGTGPAFRHVLDAERCGVRAERAICITMLQHLPFPPPWPLPARPLTLLAEHPPQAVIAAIEHVLNVVPEKSEDDSTGSDVLK